MAGAELDIVKGRCRAKGRPDLKILLVETGGWGGIWHYTCCLGNALWKLGANIQVLTCQGFEQPFPLLFQTLPVIRRDSGYLLNISKLSRSIKDIKPSILHIQSWFSARRDWFPLLIFRVRTPTVVTAHNLLPHDPAERNAMGMFFAYRRIYSSASLVIAHSKANRESLIRTFGISRSRLRIIRHGSYDFFAGNRIGQRCTVRRIFLGQRTDRRLFLIFGAMRKYKGIDLALRAVSLIPDPDRIHLIVAGKSYGRILEDCKVLARELEISSCVTFLEGYLGQAEIANLHVAADVLMFPYRDIFQSGSLQIALAFGKPIIATCVGSFPESLNGKNAWLTEPRSPADIARAMIQALEADPSTLASMSEESLRISREDQDWDKIAFQTMEAYRDLA